MGGISIFARHAAHERLAHLTERAVGTAASTNPDEVGREPINPGALQIFWSGGDGLIRLPVERVGQPDVHDAAPGREHGVCAPL